MLQFFLRRWFLIALATILAVAMVGAPALQPLSEIKLIRDTVVAIVLFLMAWPLQFRALQATLRRPGPTLLAIVVTFGLLPCFAWLVSLLLSPEMAAGLLVAAATPCTLASASVWTRRAGGNDAVAILVTIITNLLCFVITPLWLVALTGQQAESPDLSLGSMVSKLALLVVLPMTLAQCTRLSPRIAAWATARKTGLSVGAQCGILFMVFVGAIQAGLNLRSSEALLAWDLLSMLVAVCVVHLCMFWAGVRLAGWLHFSREDQIAVGFAGSQKTLMVGLLMAMSLQFSILPMVAYHVSQLLIDTVIADRYRQSSTT